MTTTTRTDRSKRAQRAVAGIAEQLRGMAFELATGTGLVEPRKFNAAVDHLIDAVREEEHQRRLAEPIFRHCVVPACFAEFDIAGNVPEKSGRGWLQSTAVGYCCPEHAKRLWADRKHAPRWVPDGTEGGATLRCACGWDSGPVAFRGHGTVLWQVHALDVLKGAQQ